MKIAIISEYSRFTSIGGTEYYVDMLIEGLIYKGQEVLLIGSGVDRENTVHFIEKNKTGKTYEVYLLPEIQFAADEVEQKKVSSSWELILPLLQRFNPEIVHVHTSSTFFNTRHFELCAKHFSRIFFTTHVPGHFCAKGDLIQNNQKPCNGIIGLKCYSCIFSKSPKDGLSNLLFGYSKKKLRDLKKMDELGIQMICPSYWQKQQLIENGYDERKIEIIRQAIRINDYQVAKDETSHGKFSIGYLGRLSPEKGSAMLLGFIRSYAGDSNTRFVLGIPRNSDPADIKALEQLIANSDVEINWLQAISGSNKQEFFSEIDCLFIPSYCIETGPIVLLEAMLYGKPVIAPNVGGPAEFARDFKLVHLYKWNDPLSTSSMVNSLRFGKKTSVDLDLLHQYEDNFLNLHLHYYSTRQPANMNRSVEHLH